MKKTNQRGRQLEPAKMGQLKTGRKGGVVEGVMWGGNGSERRLQRGETNVVKKQSAKFHGFRLSSAAGGLRFHMQGLAALLSTL